MIMEKSEKSNTRTGVRVFTTGLYNMPWAYLLHPDRVEMHIAKSKACIVIGDHFILQNKNPLFPKEKTVIPLFVKIKSSDRENLWQGDIYTNIYNWLSAYAMWIP